MKIKKFNPPLGKLEAGIMDIVWKLGSASVREVFNKFKKRKKIAYTTVMTVMTRLSDKDILKRKLDKNNAYIYTPILDKESFLNSVSKKAIRNLINEYGEVAVAQFIDIIESSNVKNLKEWRKKLKEIK